MDYDTIKHDEDFLIRTRHPEDRFSPAGRGVSKSLKKLFSEERVPVEDRNRLLVLENGGEILWVENFGVCERCKLRAETQRVFLLYLQQEDCEKV